MTSECLHRVETYCFSQDEQHMVLDVRHSRSFALSPLEREILAAPEGAPLETLPVFLGQRYPDTEICRALERLRKRNLLLSRSAPPEKAGALTFPAITHLQLSAAQDCNLGCRYCIVDQGSFGGPRQRMSRQVARQAVDLLLRESGEAAQCTLSFSGGEPMLDWAVVRDAIAYSQEQAAGHGKQVHYLLKTNGTLLNDENIPFIKEQRIGVQVSLDGPPAVHDRMRLTASGKGSHDLAVAGLSRLLPDCAEQVSIRAVLTRFSPPVSELMDYLTSFGTGSVRLSRVIARSDEGYALDSAARAQLKAEYGLLTRRFLAGAPVDPAAHLITGYITLLDRGRRRSHDDNGGGSLVVSASGGLYPRPELAEQERYRLGHVATGLDRDRLAWWRSYIDVDNRPVCRDCWARYICGGGCFPAAIKLQGTPDQPIEAECELIRHLIRLAVWVHVTLRERRLREIHDATRGFLEDSELISARESGGHYGRAAVQNCSLFGL
jgi:uncharacterized protein